MDGAGPTVGVGPAAGINGGVAGGAGGQAAGAGARNQEQRDPIINARDRLFHTLFFRISLAYARGCPRQIRRLIECLFLIKAVICMCMLVYIHLVYTRQPVQCLEHLADKWPRDGVLRVEIQRGGPTPGYDIYTSYEKERRLALRQRELENLGSFFSIITGDLGYTETLKSGEDDEEGEGVEGDDGLIPSDNPPVVDFQPNVDVIEQQEIDDLDFQNILPPTVTGNSTISGGLNAIPGGPDTIPGGPGSQAGNNGGQEEKISTLSSTLDYMKDRLHSLQEALKEEKGEMTNERLDSISEYGQDIGAQASKLKTVIVNMTDELGSSGGSSNMAEGGSVMGGMEEGSSLLDDRSSDLEKLSRLVWAEDGYIIEYSLEIGFLRLSPATRQKLNIPVHIEILDPNTNPCFGDAFSRFILENMLGYEDVLMSSVKTLAEKENNKGFLRNVVTGAQYHFKAKWTSVTSYIPAVLVMIVFTISISMLLRYSQHQIFVFIIDLLQMVELNTNITFPVAPLLTVILALVGMEAIMSEFFEDTTTAFYIILLVWLCDQYDSICCHTPITKRYWLRFFYLYHTAFYAYHYRFSGQYSGLALLTMWLFTQHSMIYFFHHYELPVILQQAQIRDILNRSNGQVHINFNNVVSMNNNNNNNAANANNNNMAANNNNNTANNVVRRIIRPRFTLGRFQFRFVFQALHNPTPPPQQQPTTAQVTTDAENTPPNGAVVENQSNNTPLTTAAVDATILNESAVNSTSSLPPSATADDTVNTAAIQQYAAQVVESAREMELLDVTDRLNTTTVSGTGAVTLLNREEELGSLEDNDANNSHGMQQQHQQQQQHLHNDEVLEPTSVINSGDISTDISNTNNSSIEGKISCDNTSHRDSISPYQINEDNQELSDSIENVIDAKDVAGERVIKSCDNNDIVNLVERDDVISRNQDSAEDATAIFTTTPPHVTGAVDSSVDENTSSIRSDLREIRSTLADAAREASELLQELGNRNQE